MIFFKKKNGNVNLFKKQVWLTPQYKRAQRERQKFLKNRGRLSEKEKGYFKKLEKIVFDGFKTDNKIQKFRLEDFDKFFEECKINPIPDILFIYGKKNIGKTWALAREVQKMRNRNPNAQFVFIRNRKQETEAMDKVFEDEIWPVVLIGGQLYWKDEVAHKERKERRPAGIFAYSTEGGFQKWQGSSYENVELIIWDECNDVGGSGLNSQTIYKFHVFCSSIIRDKKNVRKLMVGNLLSKDDQSMNMFLSRLSLPQDIKFKLIDVHADGNSRKEVVSRLMYVNTSDWYRGIESQKGLPSQFLTEEEESSLLQNIPRSMVTKCIYSEYEFLKAIPIMSLAYTMKVDKDYKPFILYLAKVPDTVNFVLWIEPFNPNRIKPDFRVFTNDEGIAGDYVAPIFVKSIIYYKWIKFIYNILQLGQLYYGYNGTYQYFAEARDKLFKQVYTRGNPANRMRLGYNK